MYCIPTAQQVGKWVLDMVQSHVDKSNNVLLAHSLLQDLLFQGDEFWNSRSWRWDGAGLVA